MDMQVEAHTRAAATLRQLLTHQHPEHFMLFVDQFAMGCLLHLQGERAAAYRLIAQVLAAAGDSHEKRQLAGLLKDLSGNEVPLVREIGPNPELLQLCERVQDTRVAEPACGR